MSRALSNARSGFERANVDLEDVLLREMGQKFGDGTIGSSAKNLSDSNRHLHQMQLAIRLLRKNMKEHNFEDLHKLLAIDPAEIAGLLGQKALAHQLTLREVADVLKTGGFYAVLDVFEATLASMRDQTEALGRNIGVLREHEEWGNVTRVLESNLPGNVRGEFARLYSSWNMFQELFLASSVLSTEIWYRWIKAGSLLTGPQPESAVA